MCVSTQLHFEKARGPPPPCAPSLTLDNNYVSLEGAQDSKYFITRLDGGGGVVLDHIKRELSYYFIINIYYCDYEFNTNL